jgi:hypothetical protein
MRSTWHVRTLRLHRHATVMQIFTSILQSYLILFYRYDWNQNRHIGDLVKYTGLLFRKVANSTYHVPSKMFQSREAQSIARTVQMKHAHGSR